MSRSLLSRIKRLQNLSKTPKPTSPLLITPHIKRQVHQTLTIIKTQPISQWQYSFTIYLDDGHETNQSSIAHLVFDKMHDINLTLTFFHWVSKHQPSLFSLDGYAYSSLLRLLARFREVDEIENVLKGMDFQEMKPTRQSLSCVIHTYVNCGLIDKAVELFYLVVKLHSCVPNVVACNALLDRLVKGSQIEVARKVYDEMVARDGNLDNYSVCIMINGMCKEGQVEEAKKIVKDRFGVGCMPNIVFYNVLIDGYCKKSEVGKAYGLFKELKRKGFLPTLQTYGAMISGFSKEGDFDSVNHLVSEMKARGLNNAQLYNTIIDARYKHGCKSKAMETMKLMIENGCKPDIATYNTLISGSCRDGKVEEASQLLEQAIKQGLVPNKITYTPLIHGYCQNGDFVKASDFLFEMAERGHTPDLIAYLALVNGLVVNGGLDVALSIRDKMMEKGVIPDASIYNVLINGLCKKGRLPAAKMLLAEMLDQNVSPDEFVYATLVDGFIKNDEFLAAKEIFELAIKKGIRLDIVVFNAMLKGYCKFGTMNDALSSLNNMVKNGLAPDQFTYSTLIDGYVKQCDLNGALRIFAQMVIRNCKPNVVTYTSLIDGFCRNGDFNEAEKAYNEMQHCGLVPNIVTYSILIKNFCKVGKLAKAVSFFELMLKKKCVPKNDVIFHYLLNGFTNNAFIVKSIDNSQEDKKSVFQEFFEKMILDGFDLRTSCYNSILVCLCQHGMLKTALDLHNKMICKGFVQDSVSFAALLYGVCLEGKSDEWMSIISCHLDIQQLRIAQNYIEILNQYLPQGITSEASLVLENLVQNSKYHEQESVNLI
ncbi:hypothetical protein ACFE04_012812 [Oxalis oulophora]